MMDISGLENTSSPQGHTAPVHACGQQLQCGSQWLDGLVLCRTHVRWWADEDAAFDDAMAAAHARWQSLRLAPPHLPGDASPLYGVMPDWNPAEIIGTAPGALAASIYRHLIMDETWATQRAEYGYRDVRPAPLLVEFAGHPYVDVRASFASFLPAELPEGLAGRLLSFYLEWLRQRPELHEVPTYGVGRAPRWERHACRRLPFGKQDRPTARSASVIASWAIPMLLLWHATDVVSLGRVALPPLSHPHLLRRPAVAPPVAWVRGRWPVICPPVSAMPPRA